MEEPAATALTHSEGPASNMAMASYNQDQPATQALAQAPRLLVVDDDGPVRELFADALGLLGQVDVATNGIEALAQLGRAHYDLVLSDVDMPHLDGCDFFDVAVATQPELVDAFVFVTGGGDTAGRLSRLRRKGVPVLHKPVRVDELRRYVAHRLSAVAATRGRAVMRQAAPRPERPARGTTGGRRRSHRTSPDGRTGRAPIVPNSRQKSTKALPSAVTPTRHSAKGARDAELTLSHPEGRQATQWAAAGEEGIMGMVNGMAAQELSRRDKRASAEAAIRRMTLGDDSGLAELYDRYAPLVTGLALRILRDPADAQDVLQAVFLQAWLQADRYDASRGAPEAWLCTITRTRALDQLRRRVGLRERPETANVHHMATPSTVERLAVQRALSELSPLQRHALELAYYEGLTQSEIATRLGEPLGTIKTRIRDAMIRLRGLLSEEIRANNPGGLGIRIQGRG